MKTIKRWINNIAWLLNHPPSNFTSPEESMGKCEYCDREAKIRMPYVNLLICWHCIKEIADKVLKDKKGRA